MTNLPTDLITISIESAPNDLKGQLEAEAQLAALKSKIAEMELMEEILLNKIIELHMERVT